MAQWRAPLKTPAARTTHPPGRPATPTSTYDETRTDETVGDRRTKGYDTSGPTTDDATTCSEERLRVDKERVTEGRARLRKHVVTENQTVTVPVSHAEVTLEREPISDANRGAATSGRDLSDEEYEVQLTQERVVVDNESVPVERVRLGTETVTENQRVSEDVRKEEIESDGADGDGQRRQTRNDTV